MYKMDEEPVLNVRQTHCSDGSTPSPCFCQRSSAFFVNSLQQEEDEEEEELPVAVQTSRS